MKEFLRGVVRLHVLHHAAEAELHGAWITAELARHGYQISPGTLYPTLHRMQAEGLLTSRQEVVDGRARRVYRATPAGLEALAQGRTAVAELARELLGAPEGGGSIGTGRGGGPAATTAPDDADGGGAGAPVDQAGRRRASPADREVGP
jgi:DNA-binding PadR family transcriptional regulator